MTNLQQIIYQRLEDAFAPVILEVIDDSHKHKGHVGAENGAGHYTVKIQSRDFEDSSRLEIHRKIYKILDDLIPEKIHALRITLIPVII